MTAHNVPTRPDGRPLYSFSTIDTRPVGAEDYYRVAYARLRSARNAGFGLGKNAVSAAQDGKSPLNAADSDVKTHDARELDAEEQNGRVARDPFTNRHFEMVTVVKGNTCLVITSGHGGTLPIPVDYSGGATIADFDRAKSMPEDLDSPPDVAEISEEDASKRFVPVRSKRQLPGFATVMDDHTAHLAELVYLELLRKLNPESNIDFAGEDLSTLHKRTDLIVPHLSIARFSRRFCDANRPGALACEHPAALSAHSLYHGSIATAVASIPEGKPGLLLDIHGQSEFPDKMLRGSLDGISVTSLLARHGRTAFDESESSLLGRLESLGLAVYPSGLEWAREADPKKRSIIDARLFVKDFQDPLAGHLHLEPPPFQPEVHGGLTPETVRESPGYRGGWTVQRYGSHTIPSGHTFRYDEETGKRIELIAERPRGIDAVQLEIGSEYRKRERIVDTAEKLAEGLVAFYREYL